MRKVAMLAILAALIYLPIAAEAGPTVSFSYNSRGVESLTHKEFFGESVLKQGIEFKNSGWYAGAVNHISPMDNLGSDTGDRVALYLGKETETSGLIVDLRYRFLNINFWEEGDEFKDRHEATMKAGFSPTALLFPYFLVGVNAPVKMEEADISLGIGTEIKMNLVMSGDLLRKNWLDVDCSFVNTTRTGSESDGENATQSLKIQVTSTLGFNGVPFDVVGNVSFLNNFGEEDARVNSGGIQVGAGVSKNF